MSAIGDLDPHSGEDGLVWVGGYSMEPDEAMTLAAVITKVAWEAVDKTEDS